MWEQKYIVKVELVTKRKIDIEVSKDDAKRTFNGSKGSNIEHRFINLSDYKSEDFYSNCETYITGVSEN